ncbi:redoxin domain-containing protein [Actibacterium sp.]|uniref:redoxin domain-containing protein n=1 Tax=Actibacterium sp. TaxID=1872125 RepID=UPI00356210D2
MLVPMSNAPTLRLPTVAHGPYDLAQRVPPGGTLVSFYRSLHCGICKTHLKELDDRIGDFAIRGVRLIAVSTDTPERSQQLVSEMQIIRLPVGHSLDLKAARDDWGLMISTARDDTDEPAFFSEPALYWVRQDGTIGFSLVLSVPFMRPEANQILRAIDAAKKTDAPPRGAYTGPLP